MQISSLPDAGKLTRIPLEKLAANSSFSEAEKLGEVSRQFEAVLVRQILTQAQKPVFKSEGPGAALCNDVYRDLMTHELANQISRSGLGLARGLETQLQRQNNSAAAPATDAHPSTASHHSVPHLREQKSL